MIHNKVKRAKLNKPIADVGFLFAISAAIASVFLFVIGGVVLTAFAIILAVFGIFSLYFFRNPNRTAPNGKNLIISPADGKVQDIIECKSDFFKNGKCRKIAIFMSVFNVHVNRSPVDAVIKNVKYKKGKFLPADDKEASLLNESNTLYMETEEKKHIIVTQIAGIIARRIVCYAKQGDIIDKGEAFGLIKFGSRLEVSVPVSAEIRVKEGDNVKAGVTVLGEMK